MSCAREETRIQPDLCVVLLSLMSWVGELFPGRQEGADGSRQIPDFSKERETDIPKDLFDIQRPNVIFMSQTSHLVNFTSVCPASRPNPSDPVPYKGQESHQPGAGIPRRLFQEPSGI